MKLAIACAAPVLLLAACASTEEATSTSLPGPTEAASPAIVGEPPAESAADVAPPAAPEPETPPGPETGPPPGESTIPAEDPVDSALRDFNAYILTGPDSSGIVDRIEEIGRLRDPRVAASLKRFFKHEDDQVVIAAARNIGKQGDPGIASILKMRIDSKDTRRRPAVMAALIEVLGDVDPDRNYKFLLDIGKKYINSAAEIACPAFRAAAKHESAETVDDLTQMVVMASFVQENDSAEKKASRAACEPVLREALVRLTGEEFRDLKAWLDWWRSAKKTWKPLADR